MYPFLKPGDRLVIRKISAVDIQTGDILAVRTGSRQLAVHRVIQSLSGRQFITKGDCMPTPDAHPANAEGITGKVAVILRGNRLIPVATGHRERLKRFYAWLSKRNLTRGCVKSNFKQLFNKVYNRPASGAKIKGPTDNRQFLYDLLRHEKENSDWQNVDLKGLEATAVREGLAGYIYPLVKKCGASEATVAVIKKHYLSIAARNLIALTVIERLEADLQAAGLEIMLLKGAALQEVVYRRPGLRFMEDVDIMVQPADQSRFVRILARHGFRPDPDRADGFIKGNTLVDLHTDALNSDRIASRRWLFPAGMQPVWAGSLPWKNGLQNIRRPSNADNILLLSQHAVKHAFERTTWLVDIWLLLKGKDALFWEGLYRRAAQLKQLRCLYQVLFLLERRFKLDVKPPFESPGGQLNCLEAYLLVSKTKGFRDKVTGILLACFSLAGSNQRLRFVYENIFLKRETAQKEFGRRFSGRPVRFYLSRLWLAFSLVVDFIRR